MPSLPSRIVWRAAVATATALAIVVVFLAVGHNPTAPAVRTVASIATAAPTSPPVQVCGNSSLLTGPATAPAGAVTVPTGDNSALPLAANTIYWFAAGTHTLGTGQFSQIIPKDGDTFIGAPGAIIDGQKTNLYAFTQLASNVTIEYLTIQNFGPAGSNRDAGVVNHDAGHNWTIKNNTVQGNAGAGVFIGTGNSLTNNCLTNNQQYGFSAYAAGGVANITMDHNEISGNNTYDWESKVPGCGCTGGGKFFITNGATVTNNWSHNNRGPGFWADTNDNDFDFEGNYISDNDESGIEYEISYNALIKNNTFVRNALKAGAANPGFPTGAIYLSESGGDNRVPSRYSTLRVTGNQFTDNWSGVVLWENSDRFCGSDANTSTGTCTLVNPSQANLNTCVAGTINSPPYYSDCRWKTQNVSVDHNEFYLNPANLTGCTPAVSCGLQGMFSNYGTYPSWSPYKGKVIEDAITFSQNDQFASNDYVGPWQFMAHDQSTVLDTAVWQGAPYSQDPGSTFGGMPPAANLLDVATATLESAHPHWASWYSATESPSTEQAHGGKTSLKVEVTAPWGWGLQLDNYPGFPAAAAARTVGFWGLAGSPGTVGSVVTIHVEWKDASGKDLSVTDLPSPALSSTWAQASANATAPTGTTSAWVTITGTATAGNHLYLDDFFIG